MSEEDIKTTEDKTAEAGRKPESSDPETGRSRGVKYAYSKRQRRLMTVAALVFLAIAIFSGVKIIENLADNAEGNNYYEDILSSAVATRETEITEEVTTAEAFSEEPETTSAQAESSEASEAETEAPTEARPTQTIDFEALWAINEDVVAWIELPDSDINYPIVQGDDNEQYLRTLLDGSYHRYGTLFIDAANDPEFQDDITIIYGHHIYSGGMFCEVESYDTPEFYESHQVIWLYTPEHIYKLEPYSANIFESTYFITTNFNSTDEYQNYISNLLNTTYLAAHIGADASYKTVALFTCSESVKDHRFVVFCRMSLWE